MHPAFWFFQCTLGLGGRPTPHCKKDAGSYVCAILGFWGRRTTQRAPPHPPHLTSQSIHTHTCICHPRSVANGALSLCRPGPLLGIRIVCLCGVVAACQMLSLMFYEKKGAWAARRAERYARYPVARTSSLLVGGRLLVLSLHNRAWRSPTPRSKTKVGGFICMRHWIFGHHTPHHAPPNRQVSRAIPSTRTLADAVHAA